MEFHLTKKSAAARTKVSVGTMLPIAHATAGLVDLNEAHEEEELAHRHAAERRVE
jgi:hypothetical protein